MISVQDTTGAMLRVRHNFHPALAGSHLYEVTVSVENEGTAPGVAAVKATGQSRTR